MQYFLTIAASDNSGGAGIQKDISVARDLGYRALSAISGITVQNFEKVFEVHAVDPRLLQSQIEQCLVSFPVSSVKIGAICSKENIRVIAACLKKHPVQHVVLDPVLVSTSGKTFLDEDALDTLKEILFPLTELVTPNKPEFERLTGQRISTVEEGTQIARDHCREWKTSILLKGGHFNDNMIKEALITGTRVYSFTRERKSFRVEHGTGCTVSSALACYLGKNNPLPDSCRLASEYLVRHYEAL